MTSPTLTGIHRTRDAVTFTALQGAGEVCTLTVPRGSSVRLGMPLLRLAGMPVSLIVTERQEGGEDQQPRMYGFEVYPETPEGAACLETLDMSGRVGLPETEARDLLCAVLTLQPQSLQPGPVAPASFFFQDDAGD